MNYKILIDINNILIEMITSGDPGCMVNMQYCRAMLRSALDLFGNQCLQAKRKKEQPFEMYILLKQINELSLFLNNDVFPKITQHLENEIGKRLLKQYKQQDKEWEEMFPNKKN